MPLPPLSTLSRALNLAFSRLLNLLRPLLARLQALPRLPRRILGACASLLLLLGLAWIIPLPARLFWPGSSMVLYADQSVAHVFLAPDDRWRIPARLDELDPAYLQALLALEDRRFYAHPGVDPLAVARAILQNLSGGRVVSGASTLTMQLVRVLEPRPRTFLSKGLEALRAVQLELRLSKRQILEAYLTFIPFGRNLEGIEAGSLACFGHRPSALTAAEVATLLAVPQDPNRRFPLPAHEARLKQARDAIALRLMQAGRLPGVSGGSSLTAENTVSNQTVTTVSSQTSPQASPSLSPDQAALSPDQAALPPDQAALAQLRDTPPPTRLRPFPREVPHAAVWLRQSHRTSSRLYTSLDRGLQHLAERLLQAGQDQRIRQGVHNATVILANHRTGTLLALVGNVDFWDARHGGQLPGFALPRSVGSLLKPFVYAQALDKGLALPDFRVMDVPVQLGSFVPHNYENRFEGLVRLEDALARSLNIPFMLLLQDLGVEGFLGSLRRAGVRSLSRQPGHYGLPAVAGAIELTPLEVAGLYATLAEGGLARPLRVLLAQRGTTRLLEPGSPGTESKNSDYNSTGFTSSGQTASRPGRPNPAGTYPEATTPDAERVFSPEACWLTWRALSLRDRPDFPARRQFSALPPAIHWKTGTSYGHRDAWAAGSSPELTGVVWLGNFTARPSAALVGAELAAPVLFDLLEAAQGGKAYPPPPPPPAGLITIETCAWSGFPPAPACPSRRKVLALQQAVPAQACPFHVTLDIDTDTGLALSPACRTGRSYHTETFTVFPPKVQRWMKDQGRLLQEPPTFMPGCAPGGERRPPTILSPQPGQVTLLMEGLPTDRQEVPLEAESSAPGARLSWFVDGAFVGTSASHERLWWEPRPGIHQVLVTDEAGQKTERVLEVRQGQ